MLQKKTNSETQGEISLKAENLPLYFYDEKDNKIVKVQKDQSTVFYQIKRYENKSIVHSYGGMPPRLLEEIAKDLENMTESTFERFKEIVSSYHQKERENAITVRKQVFKIEESLQPIIIKPDWISTSEAGELIITMPKNIRKTKIKATFIIY